jgi:hypothetical protein
MNPGLVVKMPDVGRGAKSRIVINHNGCLSSSLAAVLLLPESQSAIVVLMNTLANNDAADWIAQLLLETLIDSPEKNDYEALAQESVTGNKAQWARVEQTLREGQIPNTTSQPLHTYEGKYFNKQGNWFMDVFLQDDQLVMCEQGDRSEVYPLKHYHNDVFSWELSQDESARRGRFPYPYPEYYLLTFQTGPGGVSSLLWTNDGAVPEPEVFKKYEEGQLGTQAPLHE